MGRFRGSGEKNESLKISQNYWQQAVKPAERMKMAGQTAVLLALTAWLYYLGSGVSDTGRNSVLPDEEKGMREEKTTGVSFGVQRDDPESRRGTEHRIFSGKRSAGDAKRINDGLSQRGSYF